MEPPPLRSMPEELILRSPSKLWSPSANRDYTPWVDVKLRPQDGVEDGMSIRGNAVRHPTTLQTIGSRKMRTEANDVV